MNRSGNKNGSILILLLLGGIVLGGFIGQLTEGVKWVEWLNYGQSFGLSKPLVLDLGVILLTFALKIRITIAGILGMLIAIVIYRRI